MGTLYIVATPIGNLDDLTFRALKILQTVDLILCEDTRQTRILLSHYQIENNVLSFHQHSDQGKVDDLLKKLKSGLNIALVSDAGTPGICDPGGKLVEAVYIQQLPVVAIPGASAVSAALSVSGFSADEYIFFGFLPHKKGRQKILTEIIASRRTVALYESVHRVEKLLRELIALDLQREVFLARELTKKFETSYRGDPLFVLEKLQRDKIKGEFVLVINGQKKKELPTE